jgi:hypothetical protein
LNLGTHVGDAAGAVRANRRLLARAARLPREPAWLNQVHGTTVIDLDAVAADGYADGAVTSRPGVVCALLTADCLPILLADAEGTRIGALHAGWRGLAGGIIANGVVAMNRPPARLRAWLGPAIRQAAYEVGDEVRDAFLRRSPAFEAAFARARPGHWRADLAGLATVLLQHAGVTSIRDCGLCTHADPDRFFSHRRDGRCGRMATLIWITPPSRERVRTPARSA